MIHTYYPVPSQAAGEALSRALWDVVRPPAERGAADTVALYAVVQDAAGAWWLEVPEDHAEFPVEATLTEEQLAAAVAHIERMEDGTP